MLHKLILCVMCLGLMSFKPMHKLPPSETKFKITVPKYTAKINQTKTVVTPVNVTIKSSFKVNKQYKHKLIFLPVPEHQYSPIKILTKKGLKYIPPRSKSGKYHEKELSFFFSWQGTDRGVYVKPALLKFSYCNASVCVIKNVMIKVTFDIK